MVINTKRAQVNKRSLALSTKFDSEGSRAHTADINYGLSLGAKRFGFRLNLIDSGDRYYRPFLGLDQRGVQTSVTLRPYSWSNIFGDYRYYERAAIISAGATVRTPAGFTLSNGVTMDNQSTASPPARLSNRSSPDLHASRFLRPGLRVRSLGYGATFRGDAPPRPRRPRATRSAHRPFLRSRLAHLVRRADPRRRR